MGADFSDLAQHRLLNFDRRLEALEIRIDFLLDRLNSAERVAATATEAMERTQAQNDLIANRLRKIERRLELSDE